MTLEYINKKSKLIKEKVDQELIVDNEVKGNLSHKR
jgi:hypothetical protein